MQESDCSGFMMMQSQLGLLFSGQGAQHVGMGLDLYEYSSLARQIWDDANDILGFDLKKICFYGPEDELTQTKVCQPALYVHGYTLFKILEAAGHLNGLALAMGNSLGELTAHAVAQTFDFATGLQIVAHRGAWMQEACEQTQGGMAAILGGQLADVQALCADFDLDISNINSPGQVVISGKKENLDQAIATASTRGFKRAVPLVVAGAYHSRLMQPAQEAFKAYLETITFQQPQITVITNVTGQAVTDPQTIKNMLVEQITATVNWVGCVQEAQQQGITQYYECGPGGILTSLVKKINPQASIKSIAQLSELHALSNP